MSVYVSKPIKILQESFSKKINVQKSFLKIFLFLHANSMFSHNLMDYERNYYDYLKPGSNLLNAVLS